MLTQARLKSLVEYSPETGLFVRKITKGPAKSGRVCGNINGLGYVQFMIDGKLYLAHRLAWLYVYGVFPEGPIDHINRNKQDNRLNNLRACTNSENEYNKSLRKVNTSGVTGVTWVAKRNKWQVQIRCNKEQVFIGRFNNFEDAVKARKNGEKLYHKDFAPEDV